MKKKITALILVIPLIFMFTVFSAGQAAAISIPVSVSSISIDNKPEDDTLMVEYSTYEQDPYIFEVSVAPTAAANKSYTFVSSDSNVATVDSNNKLCIHDVGRAEVEVRSVDGGFKDKITVIVTSNIILRYSLQLQKKVEGSDPQNVTLQAVSNQDYDYVANVSVGEYIFREKDIHPSNLQGSYTAEYSTSNSNVATMDALGNVVVRASGSAILTCEVEGMQRKLLLNTSSPVTESGIVVEGKDNATFTLAKTQNTATYLIETATDVKPTYECDVAGVYVNFVKVSGLAKATTTLWNMSVSLPSGEKSDSDIIEIRLNIGGQEDYVLTFIFADSVMNVFSQSSKELAGANGVEMLELGREYTFVTEILPFDQEAQYEYVWTSSNDKLVITKNADGSAKISVQEAMANVQVSLEVKLGETVIGEKYTFAVTFIPFYNSINIIDSGRGIENVLAIGEYQYNSSNQLVDYNHQFNVKIDSKDQAISADDFKIESSSNVVAKIADGKLVLDDITSDAITAWVKITWKYSSLKGANVEISDTFNFNAIKDGVQIGMGKIVEDNEDETKNTSATKIAEITATTSPQLVAAAESGKPIVLVGDVYLSSDLQHKEMGTTWDWTQHSKQNNGEQPTIKYLVEFKNSVFGNGYFINAHNKTTQTVKVTEGGVQKDVNLFNGPLDLFYLDLRSSRLASVKGQDNISFLIRNDDVVIDNVELWGCKDSQLFVVTDGVEKYEINKLNKIGTVLEIMSNAKIINSRVRNGRTCIRVFGRDLGEGQNPIVTQPLNQRQVASERISPVISNCIVEQAREFLLKIGANRAIHSNSISSPSLGGYSLPSAQNSNVNNTSFYNNYVITDVKVSDSVFKNSGLFCIGVETHFSGLFLDNAVPRNSELWTIRPFNSNFDYDTISGILNASGWNGLSATSYASKITLDGQVEFLDWKIKDNIDSSTLIEMGMDIAFLDLRINEMVQRAANNDPSLSVLFDNGYDKVNNVETPVLHGGICFYGGGKNYSEVITGQNSDLNLFNVNLSILAKGLTDSATGDDEKAFQQGMFLPYAAGTEDFRFYMYTNNGGHTYDKVEQMIANDVVNSIVYTNPASPV